MGYGLEHTIKDLKNRFADRLMELRSIPYLVTVKYISKVQGYKLIVYDPVSTKLRDNHKEVYTYSIKGYNDINDLTLNFEAVIETIILKDNMDRFLNDDF